MRVLLAFAFLFGCSSAPMVIDLVKEAAEGLRKKEEKVKPAVPAEPKRIYSTPEEAAEVFREVEEDACRLKQEGLLFKREILTCEEEE